MQAVAALKFCAKVVKVPWEHYIIAARKLKAQSFMHVAPYTLNGAYPAPRIVVWANDNIPLDERTTQPTFHVSGYETKWLKGSLPSMKTKRSANQR